MAILKVARLGHPVLREKARELTLSDIGSPEIGRLVADMIDTMDEYDGIGLAAPQVHQSVRLALLGFEDDSARYPGMGKQDLLVLINPVVTVLDPTLQGFWEGCLSVPGLKGLVYRPRKVRIDFMDLQARKRSIEAEGFLSTVFQHELDHLDGVVFLDRVQGGPGERPIAFTDEYERYHLPDEDSDVGELDD
jgi:peptide deformylase